MKIPWKKEKPANFAGAGAVEPELVITNKLPFGSRRHNRKTACHKYPVFVKLLLQASAFYFAFKPALYIVAILLAAPVDEIRLG